MSACSVCGTADIGIFRCSRCQDRCSLRFCGGACFAEAWQQHKALCTSDCSDEEETPGPSWRQNLVGKGRSGGASGSLRTPNGWTSSRERWFFHTKWCALRSCGAVRCGSDRFRPSRSASALSTDCPERRRRNPEGGPVECGWSEAD